MTAILPSEDPNPTPGTTSSTPRRPIFQTETTGNYWSDVREAFKVRRRSMRPPPPPSVPRHALTDTMLGALVEIVAS